jgi:hypothetical protein
VNTGSLKTAEPPPRQASICKSSDEHGVPMLIVFQASEAPRPGPNYITGPPTRPLSEWRLDDRVYLLVGEGKSDGPYIVTRSHPPDDQHSEWRYDLRDHAGRRTMGVDQKHIVSSRVDNQPTETQPPLSTRRARICCYECENVRFRDEHGFTCPKCASHLHCFELPNCGRSYLDQSG